jgi:hypothetical protein
LRTDQVYFTRFRVTAFFFVFDDVFAAVFALFTDAALGLVFDAALPFAAPFEDAAVREDAVLETPFAP